MRRGIRIGIDVGKVRVGVARSDADGLLATPVGTFQRESDSLDSVLNAIVAEVSTLEPLEFVIGLPLSLSGAETASTADALDFARALQARVDGEVLLIDERLTTVSAHSVLRSAGKKTKQTKQIVDQVAAVMILQHALDTERSSHRQAGKPIGEFS